MTAPVQVEPVTWRELERERRLAHPEIRGVTWTCWHSRHEPPNPLYVRPPRPAAAFRLRGRGLQ